jgi:hypothetical protein
MDDRFKPQPVAGWFMAAAAASLLFMALGCVMYLTQVFADPNAMSLDQRAAIEAEPAWVVGAMAASVWFGLIGTVLLLMKRKAAEWVLLVSVVAVVFWLAGLLVVAPLRESLSTGDLVVALAVTALTWTIYWFARHSRQRGWLR